MFWGDECIDISKNFCHIVRVSSAYAFFLCFTCRHLLVTAQQNRVPRLLLNEPEIGSHYLWYRNIILNSGCFSDPRHCQCSSSCLKQIFSHAPLHSYMCCMDLTHTIYRKTGIQGVPEYLWLNDFLFLVPFSSLVSEFNPMINSKEKVGGIGKGGLGRKLWRVVETQG